MEMKLEEDFKKTYAYQEQVKDEPMIKAWLARVKAAVAAMNGVDVEFATTLQERCAENGVYHDHDNQLVAEFLEPLLSSAAGTDCMDEESLPYYRVRFEDGTIVLAKAIPKLPSLASVEVRDIPFATKVEAGSEFAEKVELPLPLEEYSPYFQKDFNSKVEERISERIYLVVQFIREQEGLEVKETKIPNAVKVYHRELIAKAETLKSDKRPIEVRVNRRLDTFERF